MRHTDRPQDHLRENSFWHIPPRIRQLLRHVCDGIRRPNREGAIQHARQERNSISPPRLVVPIAPHERIACMRLRHSRHDDDRDESTDYYEEQAAFVKEGKEAVAEDDKGAAGPGY